jgi:hypothetical protein
MHWFTVKSVYGTQPCTQHRVDYGFNAHVQTHDAGETHGERRHNRSEYSGESKARHCVGLDTNEVVGGGVVGTDCRLMNGGEEVVVVGWLLLAVGWLGLLVGWRLFVACDLATCRRVNSPASPVETRSLHTHAHCPLILLLLTPLGTVTVHLSLIKPRAVEGQDHNFELCRKSIFFLKLQR